jgi:hypothetical protein
MKGNGKIIDPNADAAVRQAMMASQQQMQLAVVMFELRDRMAMNILLCAAPALPPVWPKEHHIREAYRCADLMLRIRQEKPADAPLAPTSEG